MFAVSVLLFFISKDASSQSLDALDAMFCDLSTMRHFFLKPDENAVLSKPNIDVAILRSMDIPISEQMPNPYLESSSQNDFVTTEFNDINKVLYNITETVTRSINNNDATVEDNDFVDIPHMDTRRRDWYDQVDNNHTVNLQIERSMILKIVKIQLQYIVHTRRKVEDALALRASVKPDKRYKIGYLFNRLRRLGTEQLKVVTAAMMHRKSEYFSIKSLLRMYEKVVRYDVDVKDTVNLIRVLFAKYEPFDSYAPPVKRN